MECPKCQAIMEDVEIHEVIVKRCSSCRGLWFDRSKHEYLKKLEGSEVIDDGDPEVGKSYNRQDRVQCPHCFAPMIRMVVPDQQHIWYESCSKCFSVFFDAGEFRDYVEKDLLDLLKDLFTPERE